MFVRRVISLFHPSSRIVYRPAELSLSSASVRMMRRKRTERFTLSHLFPRSMSCSRVAGIAALVVCMPMSAKAQQAATQAQAQIARQQPAVANQQQPPQNPNQQPFEPLTPKQQQDLQRVLMAWETVSQGTKTLTCEFKRWHYNMFAAPSRVPATIAKGSVKYANPDKGMFRVEKLVSFNGMDENGKPQYAENPNQPGEHWVCNGTELLEFDHAAKECKIQQLPPEMQGQRIIESPLPFVFNLRAADLMQRYWVRQVAAPAEGMILIEAYPKRQADRAQYRLVQIALDSSTYLPKALLMYAPNFNIKTAPKWDHYEFTEMKRNGIGQAFQQFTRGFINQKPPADWKVFRDAYRSPDQLEAMAKQIENAEGAIQR